MCFVCGTSSVLYVVDFGLADSVVTASVRDRSRGRVRVLGPLAIPDVKDET